MACASVSTLKPPDDLVDQLSNVDLESWTRECMEIKVIPTKCQEELRITGLQVPLSKDQVLTIACL